MKIGSIRLVEPFFCFNTIENRKVILPSKPVGTGLDKHLSTLASHVPYLLIKFLSFMAKVEFKTVSLEKTIKVIEQDLTYQFSVERVLHLDS